MSGVDSSVILVNLTNDTKIANKAIVTGISSSGTQSPSQGNVHHMIMPASNGNWYTSTVSSARVGTITLILMMVYLLSRKVLVKVYLKLACDQYYIDSERNPTGGIVGRTPNNERRYVNMAVTGIGTYASYTNSYGNTQNAGNKTGRTYKNAHEYKNYLTQKYDCLRSRDYSVNINSSLLSKAMGDEKTKQWLEYNLSLIPESIEKLKAAQSARGCKVLSVTDTINGYDSITEEVLVTDEVDPGTEKARKELEERLEKRKAEKKETEERLEKQRAEKQEQEERQYNLKIDGKDVADLTVKMVELVGTSTSTGVTENGVSTFDVLA